MASSIDADDLVAETFATLRRTQPGADAHQTETCGNQMLAGRIVKLGRYALLDAILNGSQADAASKIGRLVGFVLGRILKEYPVNADQADDDTSCRIDDRNNNRLDVPPQATERQAVVNSDFSFLGNARPENLADRLRILPSQTMRDVEPRHLA